MRRTGLALMLLSIGVLTGCGGGGSNPPLVLPITPTTPDLVMAASLDGTALAFVASATTGLAPASGSPFSLGLAAGQKPSSVIFNPNRTFAYMASIDPLSTHQSEISPFQVTGATVAPIAGATVIQAGSFDCLGVDPAGQFLFEGGVSSDGKTRPVVRSGINSDGTLTTPVTAFAALPLTPNSVSVVQTSSAKVLVAAGVDNVDSVTTLASLTVDGSGNLAQQSKLTVGTAASATVAGVNGKVVAYVVSATGNTGILQAVSVNPDGTLSVLGSPVSLSSVPDSVAVVNSGGQTFVYACLGGANSNLLGFGINADGSLNATGVASASLVNGGASLLADPQGNPILYVSQFGTSNNLSAFSIGANGALTSLGTLSQGVTPNLTPASSSQFD